MFPQMTEKMHKRLFEQHQKMERQDKLYGTTTMGARGQVVIPADARKDLGLKPGDQLVVLGKFGKALGLMKTEHLTEFIDIIMKHVSGTGMEKHVEAHIKKLFGSLPASTKKSNKK